MVNGGKVPRKLFIFNIVGVYVSLVHSYFNAEEIYGVTYGFEISSEPVLLKEVSFETFPSANEVTQRYFFDEGAGTCGLEYKIKKLQKLIFCYLLIQGFLMCKIKTFTSNFGVDCAGS